MAWPTTARALASLLLLGLVASCAGRQRALAIEPPGDFTLSVTLHAPPEAELDPALPRWRRPARYIIEPDLVLRAAEGAGASEAAFPPPTRTLQPMHVRDLWRSLRDGGLLQPDHPSAIAAAEAFSPPAAATVAVIYVKHDGRRSIRAIELDGTDSDALAAAAVIDRLAELSWVRR